MNRAELILKYLKGSGLEIGGGHAPMPVSEGVRVTYVERVPIEELRKNYPNALDLNYIVDNGERLYTFPTKSQDFVINSHVLEHCQDTIGSLKNWIRVLKPGGYLWMAIPEKTQTFDKDRNVTSFDHMELDYLKGPEHSAEHHYREYFSVVDGTKGAELQSRVQHALANEVNIHFHCWDEPAMREMFDRLKPLGYEIINGLRNGFEMIWLLRKN